MRRLAPLVLALFAVAAAFAVLQDGPSSAGEKAEPTRERILFGTSVKGRALHALRLGTMSSERRVLVVGSIHGDELAGHRVIRELRRDLDRTTGLDLWTVRSINPDGAARGTRRNARGVDLNRNFSHRWSGEEPAYSGYYAGPRPFSEPEARALRDLIRRVKPDLTIHFHQPWGQVLAPCSGPAPLERLYSRVSGIPLKRCRGESIGGTATKWQEHAFPDTSAFVVEFPGGPITARAARRNARAVLRVARSLPASPGPGAESADESDEPGPSARRGEDGLERIKPRIFRRLIPYGARRKRDMANYSFRHYGQREHRLLRVETIVEHFAVASSASAVYNTFAPNRPDPEYGELPGVCSHFVINGRGRIYQLVGLPTRCRHVVGLNHLSVGIEHTGYSDGEVMGNARQLRASLRLTRWLRCRYDLPTKRVIGHAESLRSPFYRELDPDFRGRTHGDFRHATMTRYRRKLHRLGACPA